MVFLHPNHNLSALLRTGYGPIDNLSKLCYVGTWLDGAVGHFGLIFLHGGLLCDGCTFQSSQGLFQMFDFSLQQLALGFEQSGPDTLPLIQLLVANE